MLTGGYSRVSSSMMTNTFIRDIQRNLTSVANLEHQIATGKRINYPSDDPIGADRALDYKQIIAQTEQYSRNIDDADSAAQNIDSALSSMENVLFRIRDLAVRGANEAPENQQSRDALAAEIDSLLKELVHQANQKFDGKHLFAGAKTNVPPFTARNEIEFTWAFASGAVAANGSVNFNMPTYTIDGTTLSPEAITADDSIKAILINGENLVSDLGGSFTVDPSNNSITIADAGTKGINNTDTIELVFDKVVAVDYNGDMGTRQIEVGENTRIDASYAGAVSTDSAQMSVFGKYNADGAETNTIESFQHLMDLRDALYKYDRVMADTSDPIRAMERIQKGLDDIDKMRNNITNVRAKQGGVVNRMELAKNRLEFMKINTTELLSAREDVDMAEAISELVLAQNVYQSALGAGSMIIQTSLLNFLT